MMDIPYKLAVHGHLEAAIRGCETEQGMYEREREDSLSHVEETAWSRAQAAKYAAMRSLLLAAADAARVMFGDERGDKR